MTRDEQTIQRAVVMHLLLRGVRDVFFFHPANGGFRLKPEAAILKGLGVISGVPDLILLHNGRFFALELKAPGKKLTPAQQVAISQIKAAGGCATWAEGLDEAISILEMWGLLRGRAQ
jgi:hypothetical protein